MKIILSICIILATLFISYTPGYNSLTEINPHRIILNLTSEPSTSMSVTWRTIARTQSRVEFTVATDWTERDFKTITSPANIDQINLDNGKTVYHYSAILKNLLPSTSYIYRVGSEAYWSEWNQFKTAADKNTPFEFLYFGDAQHQVRENVSRLFRSAYSVTPKASFWISTGDLLDRAEYDYQWDDFFSAVSFIPRVTPFVLTPGNHEYENIYENGIQTGERLAELWRSHITQPSSTIEGLDETTFFVDYQNIRLIVLNGNDKLEEQGKWLNKLLNDNPQGWTIISLHQPIYSMGKNRDQRKTKNAFLKIIDKYNVDLVLQGHDHVYSRTYKLFNGNIVSDNDPGTVYVISNCGSDSYKIQSPYIKYAAKLGNELQLFQVISITPGSLFYKSYTVTGKLFDQFELKKSF